jgi:hypothetical protein
VRNDLLGLSLEDERLPKRVRNLSKRGRCRLALHREHHRRCFL